MPASPLQEQFGQIDICLFDQHLKGSFSPGMRILDAGCGAELADPIKVTVVQDQRAMTTWVMTTWVIGKKLRVDYNCAV